VYNNGSSTNLSVLVTGNPPQVPVSGSYAVDFDPFWNISTGAILGPTVTGTLPQISQSFSLPAGNYALSFDGATEQGANAPASRPLTVTLSGAATLNHTMTTSQPDDIGYTLFQFDFASTGGAVHLTFTPNDGECIRLLRLGTLPCAASGARHPGFASSGAATKGSRPAPGISGLTVAGIHLSPPDDLAVD
jgi:hypothetical protein